MNQRFIASIPKKLALAAFMLWIACSAKAETWYGTAFAIADGYTYVTNEHVTKDALTICLRTPNKKWGKAKIINSDRSDDLSVIRANIHSSPLALGSSNEIRKGMSVLAIGYPVPDLMGLESKVTEGIVNSLSGAAGDTRRIQISTAIQPGNSGGPLLSENGNVLGVVVSRMGRKFTEATGQVADSVGYAINIARLNALIETTPNLSRFARQATTGKNYSRVNLVSLSEPSVLLVVAHDKYINCDSEKDLEIPDFGAKVQTRAEIDRQDREAAQIAKIKLQKEIAEKKKQEEELNKLNDAKERNENLVKNELYKISNKWDLVDTSEGFAYYKHTKSLPINKSLADYSNANEAKQILKGYLASLKDESILLKGAISDEKAKLTSVDAINSYAIATIENVQPSDIEVVLIRNNVLRNWIISTPSKSHGKSISFNVKKEDGDALARYIYYSTVYLKIKDKQ
jgi:V8-like Glu-specific endopeptidase